MSVKRTELGAPRLSAVLKLRCPYCAKTNLRKGRSWFDFEAGCSSCDYRYEREEGYYTGASWMINFPVTCFLAVAGAWWMVIAFPHLDALVIAAIVSAFILLFGVWFFPFSQALWLYFDHLFHPLNDDDRLSHSRQD